jgi:hypothetical protein
MIIYNTSTTFSVCSLPVAFTWQATRAAALNGSLHDTHELTGVTLTQWSPEYVMRRNDPALHAYVRKFPCTVEMWHVMPNRCVVYSFVSL